MRITNENFSIPDRSRSGSTTVASGTVPQQGTGGNYTTVEEEQTQKRKKTYTETVGEAKGRSIEIKV